MSSPLKKHIIAQYHHRTSIFCGTTENCSVLKPKPIQRNGQYCFIFAGFTSTNTLFRHEIAYVLGQIQSPLSRDCLVSRLRDSLENDMVRHECAEALGSIAVDGVTEELGKYLGEEEPAVLRESCVVALDFADYENSGEFQYADTLTKA